MIDFSKLKTFAIPAGSVKQVAVKRISDVNAKVLWRAEKPEHYHSFLSDWVIDIAATCAIAGRKHRVCSSCGHTETVTIPPTGIHTYKDEVTPPTCEGTGKEKHTCNTCGYVEERDIPALGHAWNAPYYSSEFSSGYGQKCSRCGELQELAYVDCEHPASAYHESIITNPTCTATGTKTCSCDVCHQSWSVAIPTLDHSWGSPYYSSEFSSGYGQKCTECGELQELTYVDCEHPASAYHESIITNPTCTVAGSKTCSCDVCRQSWSVAIPATGHTHGEPVLVQEPTCTKPSEYAVYCTVCKAELDRYEDDGEFAEHIAHDLDFLLLIL